MSSHLSTSKKSKRRSKSNRLTKIRRSFNKTKRARIHRKSVINWLNSQYRANLKIKDLQREITDLHKVTIDLGRNLAIDEANLLKRQEEDYLARVLGAVELDESSEINLQLAKLSF